MKPSRLRDECMMMDEGELVSAEISDFDIDKAVNVGTLTHHYLASSPAKRIWPAQAFLKRLWDGKVVNIDVLI